MKGSGVNDWDRGVDGVGGSAYCLTADCDQLLITACNLVIFQTRENQTTDSVCLTVLSDKMLL